MDAVKYFTSNTGGEEQFIGKSCGVCEGRLLDLVYASVPVFVT
jgi:hypothetical protein